jgi:hydroxymethylbilane synthase
MATPLRIGTRDSQLAVWQATLVQDLLKREGYSSELVYMKSEGDIDIVTPLYALGVTGVFTKTLDAALLNNRIDIAVHSMKDVPTQLAAGIRQAAVLERASHKDILVFKDDALPEQLGYHDGEWTTPPEAEASETPLTIATGSIRRIAQWLHRYPHHHTTNLRGNVNTRLRKLEESYWHGAIFAAAGLERIHLRPGRSLDLDWMLPAPAQGAIMVVCREEDKLSFEACQAFHHPDTALCTAAERSFLSALMGGCSTPISALATIADGRVLLKGNVVSPDGKDMAVIERSSSLEEGESLGREAAAALLQTGGQPIIDRIRKKGLSSNDAPAA